MLIRWEDRDWNLDLTDLTNRQAEALETGLGMTMGEFYDKFEGDDGEGFDFTKPYAVKLMTFVHWLMLDQNGVKVKITDVEFPMIRFGQAAAAAMAAEAAAQPAAADREAGPDPTRPLAASAPSPAPSSRKPRKPAAKSGSPHG